MKIIRGIVALANLGLVIYGAFYLVQYTSVAYYDKSWVPVYVGLMCLWIVNIILVLLPAKATATRSPGRFRRMFGLWLDAKEHELQQRAPKTKDTSL